MHFSGIAVFVAGCIAGLALPHLDFVSTAKSDQSEQQTISYQQNSTEQTCWKKEQENLDLPIGDAERAIVVRRVYDCIADGLTQAFAENVVASHMTSQEFRKRVDSIAFAHEELVFDLFENLTDCSPCGQFVDLERAAAGVEYLHVVFSEVDLAIDLQRD